MDSVTEKDKADLAEAARLVEEGKALRSRVMSRKRQRKWRAKSSEDER